MFRCSYEDNVKDAIKNNDKIEDFLHTIMVISNPCSYQIRYKLAYEFIERMQKEHSIILYIVELAYGDQAFMVTEENNPRHLQLRANIPPLWHKENMINLGIEKLLPSDWKAVAWVDADIEFDNPHWASDALKILNGTRDWVQLFTHCIDMDKDEQILNTFTSFGYQYNKNFKKGQGINYWHPGFAWAFNRKAYEQVGKLLEIGILGSGDNIMCMCFIKNAPESLKKGMNKEYINYIAQYQNKFELLKLGYVPGIIRHYFHGLKKYRRYYEREDILINYQYNPFIHIVRDQTSGLLIPSADSPPGLINDIYNYFKERNEDDLQKEEEVVSLTNQLNTQDVQKIQQDQTNLTQTVPHTPPTNRTKMIQTKEQRLFFSKNSIFNTIINKPNANSSKRHSSVMYKGLLSR